MAIALVFILVCTFGSSFGLLNIVERLKAGETTLEIYGFDKLIEKLKTV